MHKLWKHPNGTYYVLHGPRLKSRISARTKDPAQAEIFLAQLIAASTNLAPEAPTVGKILRGYRDHKVKTVVGKTQLKFSVKALLSFFDVLLPAHVTLSSLQRYVEHRRVGDGTILREMGVLRAAFSWAVAEGWLTKAQVPEIPNPVSIPPPRDRWITKEEAKALITGAVEPHVKVFMTVALSTLARPGAVLDRKWSDVDWERKRLDLGRGHGNKNRAELVPLNDAAIAALKAAKELACTDYIVEFRGKRVRSIKNGFASACRRVGLRDVTPHILRHSGATWLIMAGVPLREIARLLGDSEKMVDKVYGKHSPEYLKNAAEALQL